VRLAVEKRCRKPGWLGFRRGGECCRRENESEKRIERRKKKKLALALDLF
jgi:hypothetical protein